MKSNHHEVKIIIEQLHSISRRHSQGIFFLITLVLVGSFFFLILQPPGNPIAGPSAVNPTSTEAAQLRAKIDTIQSQKTQLENEYNNLNQKYNAAVADSADYQQKYQSAIRDTASDAKPPYVLIAGRQVKFTFKLISGDLETWLLSIDSYETSYFRGEYLRTLAPALIKDQYDIYNNYVNLCNAMVRSGVNVNCQDYLSSSLQSVKKFEKENSIPRININLNGVTGDFYDYSFFVQPAPFVNVVKPLKDNSANDYALISELFNILKQGPTYVSEIKDTPRYPIETLTGDGGDCEDTSILMASLLKAANPNWKVQLWYIDSNNPTSPKTINHVIVYVDTGKVQTYIETTSKGEMNPYTNGIYGFPVTVA